MKLLVPACVLSLVLASACTTAKSDNPLSPSAAEPVAIGTPRPLVPAPGAQVARTSAPLVLTIENASTSGARALTYIYEGSTDSAFSAQVFRQTGVQPGDNGRTSLQVPGTLAAGQTYYWRVQATDGTTNSAFSEVAHFTVVDPFQLSAPSPISPTGGSVVSSLQPTLRTSNAPRSGTAEPVSYRFEVSVSDQFTTLAYGAAIPEQPNETELTISPLQPGTTYFWRVRAESASATSPWSSAQSFVTPSTATPPPAIPPASSPLPPSNPGPRPSPKEGVAMVEAVIADMNARGISTAGDCGAFDITNRVAWAFRNRGAGVERKPGGRNCRGHSIDIVIFTDGQTVDVLVGGGVDNGPSWQEHGVLPDWRDWWIAPADPN